ncbi:MAG TPA: shikimate kinase [Chloroflexota bacterium]
MPRNVVLVGFSGTGKSQVGLALARRLDRPFVDTDEALVGRFGMAIGEVFRRYGEAAFREAEADEVARVCAGTGAVISLGGGAIVRDASLGLAREGNLVVRLAASPETILRRLTEARGAEERPMLSGERPLERITALLAEREARFSAADATIDTEGRTIEQVVDELMAVVQSPWPR